MLGGGWLISWKLSDVDIDMLPSVKPNDSIRRIPHEGPHRGLYLLGAALGL